jgi:hypothetical protein
VAIDKGEYAAAEKALSSCIDAWERSKQPPDELAILYAKRAGVRDAQITALGKVNDAAEAQKKVRSDYDEAIRLLLVDDAIPYTDGKDGSSPSSSDDDGDDGSVSPTARTGGPGAEPAALPRAFLSRAAVQRRLGNWEGVDSDLTAAERYSGRLPTIQQTNPYLYQARSQARARLGRWGDAAEDALQAEGEFEEIGDRIRKTLSAGDAALYLYGSGDTKAALLKMVQVFKEKGKPTTNNPDDIPLLQELSRTDAELHLAYASDLYANGQKTRAAQQWESGCIRLEAFVQDGLARQEEEQRLDFLDGDVAADQPGGALPPLVDTLKKPLTLSQLKDVGTRLTAMSVGLDPESPYVTQRPGRQYYYYKLGEDSKERRTEAVKLEAVDAKLSCNRFREPAWVAEQRPSWPPPLATALETYAREVAPVPVVMPAKCPDPTKCLSLGEREFEQPALQQKAFGKVYRSVDELNEPPMLLPDKDKAGGK